MQIKITADNGTTFQVLADGPARGIGTHVGPNFTQRSSSILPGKRQGVQKSFTQYSNRKNFDEAISFDVAVEFANLRDANWYNLAYPQTVLRAGDVWFIDESVQPAAVKILKDAAITLVTITQNGVSLRITYQINGGEVSQP